VAYHGITIEGARHLVVLELAKRHGMSTIEDLVFSEIAASSALPSELRGLDDEHGIRRVEFVGLTLGGQAIRTPADGDFALGQHTSEITFE
jgi:DNA-binding transcriptional MocR family regulator